MPQTTGATLGSVRMFDPTIKPTATTKCDECNYYKKSDTELGCRSCPFVMIVTPEQANLMAKS